MIAQKNSNAEVTGGGYTTKVVWKLRRCYEHVS